MKKLTPLLAGAVLIAGVALCPPARAEFVHLSFFADVSSLGLRGDQVNEPWDTYGYVTRERPLWLDILYDPSVPPFRGDENYSLYTFSDPAAALWRMHTTEFHLPPIDIVRPLDSIEVRPDSIVFYFQRVEPGQYESFDMTLYFAAPLATGLSLPTPPFPDFLAGDWFPTPNYFTALGGETLFDLPAPGSGMVSAAFTSMHAEVVDTIPPLVPVPEPATYGLMGALALSVMAAVRRRALSPKTPWATSGNCR